MQEDEERTHTSLPDDPEDGELMEKPVPVEKLGDFEQQGFTNAIARDPQTGELSFLPKVGDNIILQFTTQSWRSDTWCKVDKINTDTGDLYLIDIARKYNVGSNYKKAAEHGVNIWIPPNGMRVGSKKRKAGKRAKKDPTQKRGKRRKNTDEAEVK